MFAARTRTVMRWLMIAFYAAAGVGHLTWPDAFLPIMPEMVPFPREVILVTGLCELAGAAALAVPRPRHLAGIMLALYALCVWPANIRHALGHIVIPHIPDSWWYHGLRLAFQPVLIWWALFCSGVIDWPLPQIWRRPSSGNPGNDDLKNDPPPR
jgi:uncharacterized membrane protein